MSKIEVLLYLFTLFFYGLSFAFHLFAFIRGRAKGIHAGYILLWLGLLFHTATGIARWIDGAHAPVTDIYELNLTGAWFMVLVFLLFDMVT